MSDRDFFLEQDRRRAAMAANQDRDAEERDARLRVQAYDIRGKLNRGERVTPEEFSLMAKRETYDEFRKVYDSMEAKIEDAPFTATSALLGWFSAYRISQYAVRCALEDRIIALETKLAEREATPDKRIIDGKLRVVGGKGK